MFAHIILHCMLSSLPLLGASAALVSSLPLLGASRSLEVTRATAKLGVQPREWPWEGGVKFTCRFRTCLIQRGPKPAGKFIFGDFDRSGSCSALGEG